MTAKESENAPHRPLLQKRRGAGFPKPFCSFGNLNSKIIVPGNNVRKAGGMQTVDPTSRLFVSGPMKYGRPRASVFVMTFETAAFRLMLFSEEQAEADCPGVLHRAVR